MFFKICIFLILLLFSCAEKKKNIELKIVDQNQIYIYIKGNLAFYIAGLNGTEENENLIKIMLNYLNRRFGPFNSIDSPKKLIFLNPYRLFFEIAYNLYYNWKNEPIKYALFEIEWLKFVNKYGNRISTLREEKRKLFRLQELDDYIYSDREIKKLSSEVYKFYVNFLLRENLYVSMEEFFSRPYRYFNLSEIENIFYRMMVIPEIVEFTDYLMRKLGRTKVIKLARMEYSAEGWKKIIGEDINNTEAEFSKYIEKYKFNSIFLKEENKAKLEYFMALYNRNNREILFKK